MGRKRQSRVLDVYIGASRVGQLTRSPSGVISFRYDSSWLTSDLAFPISLSMPLSDRVWSGEGTTGYFDGLLPDDQAIREKLATRQRAESAGAFDLLAAIGRDCVGALRFLPENSDPTDSTQMTYRPVDEAEIVARLASLQGVIHLASISLKMTFVFPLPEFRKRPPFSGLTINGNYRSDRHRLLISSNPPFRIVRPALISRIHLGMNFCV